MFCCCAKRRMRENNKFTPNLELKTPNCCLAGLADYFAYLLVGCLLTMAGFLVDVVGSLLPLTRSLPSPAMSWRVHRLAVTTGNGSVMKLSACGRQISCCFWCRQRTGDCDRRVGDADGAVLVGRSPVIAADQFADVVDVGSAPEIATDELLLLLPSAAHKRLRPIILLILHRRCSIVHSCKAVEHLSTAIKIKMSC